MLPLFRPTGCSWRSAALKVELLQNCVRSALTLPWEQSFDSQGPVVRTPVSANPGLKFNQGFFFFLSKALSRIISSILFRVSSHQTVGKDN